MLFWVEKNTIVFNVVLLLRDTFKGWSHPTLAVLCVFSLVMLFFSKLLPMFGRSHGLSITECPQFSLQVLYISLKSNTILYNEGQRVMSSINLNIFEGLVLLRFFMIYLPLSCEYIFVNYKKWC
jgi:hypothetical protein